jgi:hypothetical protein
MRLPLELLLPDMHGRWGAVSMLLASTLTLGVLLLLMQRLESRFPLAGGARLRNLLRGVLILGVAIGSTNFSFRRNGRYTRSPSFGVARGHSQRWCFWPAT